MDEIITRDGDVIPVASTSRRMTYDEAEAMLSAALEEMSAATVEEGNATRAYEQSRTEEARVAMLEAEARWQRAMSMKYMAWANRTLALINEPTRGRWTVKTQQPSAKKEGGDDNN